jgi:hypothetical protein
MTIEAERTEQVRALEQPVSDGARIRRLRVISAALALLALFLGAALVVAVMADDDSVDGNASDEVRQVLDDFATAFAEQDVELMESIITDDFFGTVDFYNPGTVEPAFTVGVTPTLLLREVRDSTFSVERSGGLLVAGDGPWTIAARETWSDPSNREEGTRLYVVVNDDGVPKIATYYYAAVKVPIVPDFGN